jgi:hypothetical protein
VILDEFSFKGDRSKQITKEFNTLVGRPRFGLISPEIKDGWVINNIKQDRKPAEIGLSTKEIEDFKN